MRLRNIPAAKPAVENSEQCIQNPAEWKGRWGELFQNDHPIFIEIGMGKGQFIISQAKMHPDINFLGLERYESVMFRAVQRLDAKPLPNLRLICCDAADLADFFEKGEVGRIYLNFSDPWPKARHAKRRLTSSRFLSVYEKVLADGGMVEFKTDNGGLFAFSKEEMEAAKHWTLLAATDDLHSVGQRGAAGNDLHGAGQQGAARNDLPYAGLREDEARNRLLVGNIMTEYEEMFVAEGKPIHKLLAKFHAFLPLFSVLIFSLAPAVFVKAEEYWPGSIEVSADAAVVMDADTGAVLYGKDADSAYYPASITKIMTTLLAVENCDMDEVVTFSEDAVKKNEGENSHISRDIGEEMTMEQCLYAVMLESANECAYAVAEHVSGDVKTFVDLMNERAAAIGCTHTHFNNPNGLPDENHYVSAYDMALISREAWQNETFRTIAGTRAYSIPPTNTHDVITPLNNHHAMINSYKTSQYLYDGCLGGKTGYTDAAGYTLVTYARRDDMTLICVVLSAPGDGYYPDTIHLFNYCFDNFMHYAVTDQGNLFGNINIGSLAENVSLVKISEDSQIVLPKAARFADAKYEVVPVENASDGEIGEIRYTYAGRFVGKGELLYLASAEEEGYPFSNLAEENSYIQINVLLIALVTVGSISAVLALYWLRRWSSDELVRRRRIHTEAKMMEFKGTTIRREKSRRRRRR